MTKPFGTTDASINTKSAFIAIIGRPNVGKSTLLNALVGRKVAIVSDKPQTTRNRIMGVLTEGDTQLVFVDTPGAHRPRTRLGDFMVKTISEAVSGVDAAVLVVEPRSRFKASAGENGEVERSIVRAEEQRLLEQCRKQKLPVILVINKTDTLEDKAVLLQNIDMWQNAYEFSAVIPMSAKEGDGLDRLKQELSGFVFDSPHFFPDEMVSDQPEKVLAAEMVREKILLLMREEIPHGVAVVVESMKERDTPRGTVLDVEANIFCERDSHKGIIIGKRGAMLQEIGSQARTDMETVFGVKVNLQCWLKVKEDWRNRQGLLGGFGYK